MASYAGLFSNKYDTRANVNAGIDEMGMDWGRLSQPKYAGMAAAEGMMGYMSGLGNVNNAPEMQEQSLIDEIMAAHPDPKTPEELEALAADLQARGLTDYAFKVREVITEMKAVATSAAANSIAANTPPDSAFSRLTKSVSNSVLTQDMVHGYMQLKWNDSTNSKYGAVGEKFFGGDMSNTTVYDAWKREYDANYKSAYEELKGEVENYSIDYQASGPTKTELNALLQNPEAQILNLENYVGTDGGNDAGNYLRDQVFVMSESKKSRLTKVSEGDSASISQTPVIDAMGGAIPSSTYDWAKELEEQYRTA
tara:strand:+ start:1228 stop:2157 length:930 start_codon:yes stop_codon:yes gene_type:complete